MMGHRPLRTPIGLKIGPSLDLTSLYSVGYASANPMACLSAILHAQILVHKLFSTHWVTNMYTSKFGLLVMVAEEK